MRSAIHKVRVDGLTEYKVAKDTGIHYATVKKYVKFSRDPANKLFFMEGSDENTQVIDDTPTNGSDYVGFSKDPAKNLFFMEGSDENTQVIDDTPTNGSDLQKRIDDLEKAMADQSKIIAKLIQKKKIKKTKKMQSVSPRKSQKPSKMGKSSPETDSAKMSTKKSAKDQIEKKKKKKKKDKKNKRKKCKKKNGEEKKEKSKSKSHLNNNTRKKAKQAREEALDPFKIAAKRKRRTDQQATIDLTRRMPTPTSTQSKRRRNFGSIVGPLKGCGPEGQCRYRLLLRSTKVPQIVQDTVAAIPFSSLEQVCVFYLLVSLSVTDALQIRLINTVTLWQRNIKKHLDLTTKVTTQGGKRL